MPVKPSDVSAHLFKTIQDIVSPIIEEIDYKLMNFPRTGPALSMDITTAKWSKEVKNAIKRVYSAAGWEVKYWEGPQHDYCETVSFTPKSDVVDEYYT